MTAFLCFTATDYWVYIMTHLNIILKFTSYLSFSKLVFPITSFFLMNAMDQKGLDFTLDKAVQKYLQSDIIRNKVLLHNIQGSRNFKIKIQGLGSP